MSSLDGIKANCECQYTLTLTDVVQGQFSETKDNFTHVPSIHEVDEEETDEEVTGDQKGTSRDTEQITSVKDYEDDESIYDDESFCSEESCEESEVSSRTVADFQFSSQTINGESNKEDTTIQGGSKNVTEDNETIHSIDCKSSVVDDKTVGLKQVKSRRKNMSFTDDAMRKIEWENQLLLRKIMAQQRPTEKILRDNVAQSRISSSAINRKKLQRKIETENILLLQRIQHTKSRVMKDVAKPGCRQTILQ